MSAAPDNVTQWSDVADARGVIEDTADVVVVGTGAGGATAARVLAEAGLDVILVEEGPWVDADRLRNDMYSAFRRYWRDMGFQVAQGRAFTPVLQGVAVGGTTVINGAIIHRIPEPIHRRWGEEHGATELLTWRRLQEVFDQLDRELHVGPVPDAVKGRNNELMEQAVQRQGIQGNVIQRNVVGCDGSGRCNQGCPTRRKQSMELTYVPRALRDGARLYATCRADRVTVSRGRASGVEGRFHDPERQTDGPRFRAVARKAVVVACSAIQSPLLLRQSGLRSPLLGRRLQAHPGTGVVGLFDDPVNIWFGATQGFETTEWWEERMKCETVGLPLELGAVRLPGLGAELMEQLADYGHVSMWGVQIRARAHGRVKRTLFGNPLIQYDYTREDVRTLKLGIKRVTRLKFEAGAREVLPGVHGLPDRITRPEEIEAIDQLPDDPRLFHCIAAHVFGTACMGADPKQSAVGPDGQCHEVRGLYVADASVFPTNMGVNPQHTICAIAWLIAENLANTAAA